MDLKITSVQNPKIKEAIRLRERRDRNEENLFLIEGYRELKRAVDQDWQIQTLFYSPEWFLGENEEALIQKIKGSKFCCSKEVFQKLSYRDRPDGLVAIAIQKHHQLSDLKLSSTPFLLIAESIEKPGNLGTILRSCDAAGVDAVILCDKTTDLYNPNVVRASVGTIFSVPVIEATSEEAFTFLKKNQIHIVAATPHAKNNFTEENFRVPLAIAMGSEQYGLSKIWMDDADVQVKIPMKGIADSLNVSSATTLLLYEVLRQRSLS